MSTSTRDQVRPLDVEDALSTIRHQRTAKLVGVLTGFAALVFVSFAGEAALLAQVERPAADPAYDQNPGELAPYYE